MYDIRPVCQMIGRLVLVLGASMLLPLLLDLVERDGNGGGFALAAFLTLASGLALVLITRQAEVAGLTRPQAFLLTVIVWIILPVFGALPFVFGAPAVSYTDAYFEAMSGLTTTGSTVFSDLDHQPRGMLFWRALLQWYGGLGIVIVAVVFLPAMRIGGMQFFRSESFDLGPDMMPRATGIASELFVLYLVLSGANMLAYAGAGMSAFDAITHTMTTISTGGFSNYDAGFGHFPPFAHYVGALFMTLAAMPFVRMVEVMRGDALSVYRDSQARAYVSVLVILCAVMILWLVVSRHHPLAVSVQESVFNVISVLTGTGYTDASYDLWGPLAVAFFFVIPLIGGCTGSTSCSAKIFRYQILYCALRVQIRRLKAPHGIFPLRYQSQTVDPEIVSSVMAYFFVFVCSLSIWTILLSLLGLDPISAMSASVAALGNLGPGLGPAVGTTGNFAGLPDTAKWLLALGMVMGRLEFLSVLVLLLPIFWRR